MNHPTQPVSSGVADLPENVAAMLAVVIPPVTGVTFYLLDKERPMVRFYSMQTILLGIVSTLAWMAVSLVALLSQKLHDVFLIGPMLGLLSGLLSMAVGVIFLALIGFQVFKAWNHVEWEIPFLGPKTRIILAKN